MPYYTLRNRKTGRLVEKYMSISEGDEYERDNPDWERLCGAPGFGDGYRLGVGAKPSDEFRSRMKQVKKTYRGSSFNIK